MVNLGNENVVAASDSSFDETARSQLPRRFTWYTAGLVGFFVLNALLGRIIPEHERLPFSVGVTISILIFQWLLFLVAYGGFLASRNSLTLVLGKPWSALLELWKDMKLALIVVGLIYVSTYALVRLSAFDPL